MPIEFIIQDASIRYMVSNNVLDQSLLYRSDTITVSGSAVSGSDAPSGSDTPPPVETKQVDNWVRRMDIATKYADSNSAIEVAKRLNAEMPVRVLLLNINGNQVQVNEVKF